MWPGKEKNTQRRAALAKARQSIKIFEVCGLSAGRKDKPRNKERNVSGFIENNRTTSLKIKDKKMKMKEIFVVLFFVLVLTTNLAADTDDIFFGLATQYDDGVDSSVAINTSGKIVEVHKSQTYDTLWYHVGRVNKNTKEIDWGPSVNYDRGAKPSISVNDDNFVIEVHKSQSFGTLWQRVGKISGYSINWIGSSANFDNGAAPSVACNSKMAIQTHKSENFKTLWFSTSLITNRASWMQDRYDLLKDKTLKQLVLPASHDSGMYLNNVTAVLGKTQDLSIYDQLSYGIRYFDLRPKWRNNTFYIYHNIIDGPPLSAVLDDVRRFLK